MYVRVFLRHRNTLVNNFKTVTHRKIYYISCSLYLTVRFETNTKHLYDNIRVVLPPRLPALAVLAARHNLPAMRDHGSVAVFPSLSGTVPKYSSCIYSYSSCKIHRLLSDCILFK
jgi:hypothetical protein